MSPTPVFFSFFFVLFSLAAAQSPVWDFDPEAIHGYPIEQPQRNDIVPGELIIDPPTLENLGFRWYVKGDHNGNATVEVAYRRKGDSVWLEALPLLRINQEIAARHQTRHFRTENLFAGSVLFLQSDTEYEVRFTMHDPDGGAPDQPRIVSVRTRGEPVISTSGRTLHVYPDDSGRKRESRNVYPDFTSAYAAAQPGDVVYLHPGTYQAKNAPYVLNRSGKEGNPIVIRGAGAGVTIIEGPSRETDLFHLPGTEHIVFEDLTLRRAQSAIRSPGSKGSAGTSWLTVRRCHIEEVRFGILTYSENSRNWYIADNVITGWDQEWYPRPRSGYMDGSHTGVNLYGQGHVVCYNKISRFSDSLAIANYYPPLLDIHKQSVNIDFYNNDLSFAMDDTIEADYGCHNVRVYRNLVYNTHTALSVQPAYGGPIYLIRNEAYGITALSLKWNMAPSGILAYHNTLVSGRNGFHSPLWSNGHLRNNLILAGSGAMITTGTINPQTTTMDYNGWYAHPDVEAPVRWTHGKAKRESYPTLAAFTEATGYEEHGILIDYSIFLGAEPIEEGFTYSSDAFDFRLRPDSAPVDAGVRLPNINDNYTGKAPDMGALELGTERPHYGPRL